jgi:cellulose synthase/poly-beta-1,6-N-acetylglucosamine synthase-like glycosyltransferase
MLTQSFVETCLQVLAAAPFVALSALGLNLFVLWTIGQIVLRRPPAAPAAVLPSDRDLPRVLVQLPVYNESTVIARVVEAAAALDWPRDRLRIQVLDDSSDGTEILSAALAARFRDRGVDIACVRRGDRSGFKAGALANGLTRDDSAFVAIFDADFVPPPDFLRRAMAPLIADPGLAFAQARWEHLNAGESPLTAAQAMMIDAHFVIEQRVRSRTRLVLPFNGTCGVWRRQAIEEAGGWSGDTLCEDLDLSIRTRLCGWRAVYLPDLAAPGELPATVAGWRAQQFRWTKGFAQVARKLLGRVWRSNLPLGAKVGLTMQTLQTACYPLSALSLVATVAILLDREHGPRVLSVLGSAVAVLGMGGSALCLATGSIVLRRWSWLRFPVLFATTLALNTGLVISNSRAVLEALLGARSAFVRTPKQGAETGRIIVEKSGPSGVLELLAGGGLAVTFAYEVGWLSPLFSLSIVGLVLVGAGLAWERLMSLAQRAPRGALWRAEPRAVSHPVD